MTNVILSTKAIKDFKEIYFKQFGIKLSDTKANKLGVDLLLFFKLIYRPIPKKHVLQQIIVEIYSYSDFIFWINK